MANAARARMQKDAAYEARIADLENKVQVLGSQGSINVSATENQQYLPNLPGADAFNDHQSNV